MIWRGIGDRGNKGLLFYISRLGCKPIRKILISIQAPLSFSPFQAFEKAKNFSLSEMERLNLRNVIIAELRLMPIL